jgi:hypothetical protein
VAPAGPPDELLVPAPGLDEDEVAPIPSGSTPCSRSLHIGTFNSLARLLYSFRPVLPVGGATTPSYAAVPGIGWSSRPCLARQRGALSPKSGIEACIGSSFFVLGFMEGWSGKSWNVRGTPIRRALRPASLMSAALCSARSAGVAWSTGVNLGISSGSAGTGSRRLVPMVGCCQGSKPSTPETLKL